VLRDSLVLPNRKNPNLTVKRCSCLGPRSSASLTAIRVSIAQTCPRRVTTVASAWLIVKEASERAAVGVLALRASKHGPAGEPAPVHPHLFRHARMRLIVRKTKSLPLAQRQAGWSRLNRRT
jgi:hypothetical protein